MFSWFSIQKTSALIDIKETILQYLSEIRITISFFFYSCVSDVGSKPFFYARHSGVKDEHIFR